MKFHPVPMKCNGCEGSPPCQEPLKEEHRSASGEVGAAHDSEPSEDAADQAGRWLPSRLPRFPVPRRTSPELGEGAKTSSGAREYDARGRSWGAFGVDVGEAAHALAWGAASSGASGPPSSG